MNIFKEVINLYKDYLQKEKMMAKAYEEITEKMEDGISLVEQIVDVLKENKKLKEHYEKSKQIIKEMLPYMPKENIEGVYEIVTHAEEFIKEIEK